MASTLPRPGATVAFHDSGGDGRAVVLTHGAGLDHSMYDAQADALRKQGHRVIVWDLRGHGASPLTGGARFSARDALDDLTALLDACALDRAVLVGHSLGGNLVQEFARSRAERVAGAIVMDATWNAGPLRPIERLALRAAAPMLAAIPARLLPGMMARASAETPAAVARAEAVFARMSKTTFLDVWRATTSFVRPEADAGAHTSLALIRGERDRTGNIATAMPAWARAAGIEEHVIAGAGHIVTWDAPDETSRVLVRLLAQGFGGGARGSR